MSDKNLKKRVEDFLCNLPEKYSIIEEIIPIEIQIPFFELTREIEENLNEEEIIKESEKLSDSGYSLEEKKLLLCKLASIPVVEAYRKIEEYEKSPDKDLSYWAKLALCKSRMLLESYLTDEPVVLISSGLGGKNGKLRYFFAGFSKKKSGFTDGQITIIEVEILSFFEKFEAELESIYFYHNFYTVTCLIPVSVDVLELFKNFINECNVYGKFHMEKHVISNVKEFSSDDVLSFDDINDKNNENER